MSGMSAMLAFGYILSSNYQDRWDGLSFPEWDDEVCEMKWPEWVDPNDPVASMDNRLSKAGLKAVKIDMYGNFHWDEVPVLLWAAESEHEAGDGPLVLEDFVTSSTAWGRNLHRALDTLELTPAQQGPKWILAPSVS